MRSRCQRYALPKLLKATAVVAKGNRSTFGTVWAAIISVMCVLTAIDGSDKNFFIDGIDPFWFNIFHGYAPFHGLDLPTPQLVPNLESEYSLF
jgi:hypothetical protein